MNVVDLANLNHAALTDVLDTLEQRGVAAARRRIGEIFDKALEGGQPIPLLGLCAARRLIDQTEAEAN